MRNRPSPPRSRKASTDARLEASSGVGPAADTSAAPSAAPAAAAAASGSPLSAHASAQADAEVVYDAGRQAWKVHGLMWLSLACAAGAALAARNLVLTYGSRPADGGVLAPLPVRLAWGGTVAALGLGFAFGMWLYGRYSIRELRWIPAGNQLRIATYRFVGTRIDVIEAADIVGAKAKRDRYQETDVFGNAAGISVDAPWLAVRLRGRRWPLVLDLKGVVTDRKRLATLLNTKKA